MTNFQEIVAVLTAVLASFGAGVKWVLTRHDRNSTEERLRFELERKKLEDVFASRISSLESRIAVQEQELVLTRKELSSYLRRVGILEGILLAHNLEIPEHVDRGTTSC